ncbi:phosphatidyl serine synthase-domain-containing protein [Endogone sp. FLAS-F59071]|nr:phosphatidyl serine synthase-domain-containing protein [Endogone sp. FLAS-F59071]|eukprot:RUS23347.1 phosphatidyl serine synthase-domain-containing protein [Endogone sp. FLAS-F59071]
MARTVQHGSTLDALSDAEDDRDVLKRSPNPTSNDDPTLDFFLHPRTLTALSLMLATLVYVAFVPVVDNTEVNVKLGIGAAVAAFILIGMLQFRDGPFIRPHVALWRAVLSLSVLYQMGLVFLLFQNKQDARHMFSYIDPSLGVPLPERSYAENCDLTWDVIKGQMDAFVIAHLLGWYGKAVVLRDYWFCWILSVMFEVMEYSLAHQLNNFAECWWDHWIMDVLICNWLGTYLGMKTCEYFEMKHYSWRGFREIPTLRGKAKRAVQQFTPYDWTKFEWGMTKSFQNYVAVILLLIIFLQVELNAFYLKYLLWLPPEHYLNIYRLCAMFLFALPATREVYQFLTDKNCNRFGPHAWLVIANIMTETIICFKFGRDEFPNPAPRAVKIFWAIFLTFLAAYPVWQFWYMPERKKRARKSKEVQNSEKSE